MRTTMSNPISSRQIQCLQASLRRIGICEREERLEWLSVQTGRPVTSTKDLTSSEARRLLSALKDGRSPKTERMLQKAAASLVGKIYSMSFRISFLNKAYSGNHTPEDFEMNKAKINVWVRKYSGTGKNITQMNVDELKKVLKTMAKIARIEEEEGTP